MKYQILFSRKNKKNISKCHLLKFLPSMQSVNEFYDMFSTSYILANCVCELVGYTVFRSVSPSVCLSIFVWFLLFIFLNNLSEGSHYLAGISNKYFLLTLLIFIVYMFTPHTSNEKKKKETSSHKASNGQILIYSALRLSYRFLTLPGTRGTWRLHCLCYVFEWQEYM